MYRCENFLQSTGCDEFGESCGSEVRVAIHSYVVVKETPKGKWVSMGFGGSWRRWISDTSRKRFAYETKEAAIVAFRKRKERQIQILTANLKFARKALELDASDYLDCSHEETLTI